MNKKKSLIIIANNNIGSGQSGGDTIFIKLIEQWQNKIDVTVFGSQESKRLLDRYKLSKIKFIKTDKYNLNTKPSILNLLKHTIKRLYLGIATALSNKKTFKHSDYCYTISDFYPDFIIGLLYKILNPRGKWISGHYLFAPRPNQSNSPYRSEMIKGWIYYISQIPTKFIARKFADIIYVTSKPDVAKFPDKKVIVIRGGVDTKVTNRYLKSKKSSPKIFDGLFFGRLHPQKGVLELIDIWKILCQKIPNAKLAIIGDGPLEKQLKIKINKYKLKNNIKLFGFQSGELKNKIIKQSKIILHPAIYDSGGMAAAEAMAFGLPGVSFDLSALKTYYPKGMLKTPINNFEIFAQNIFDLLTDKKQYNYLSSQAIKLIKTKWDWVNRAKSIYEETFN